MKSDQEFLAGVYAKARRMAAEEKAALAWSGQAHSRRQPALQRAAVAALIVLLPLAAIISVYLNSDLGYRKIDAIHIASFFEYQALLEQSDLVVTGHFNSFAAGVYLEDENILFTDASFDIDRTIKGELTGTITIRLQGGKDPFRRVFADLEVDQSTKAQRLLFLRLDDNGYYQLCQSSSGCFNAREDRPGTYINRDHVEVTLDQVIKQLQGVE
jgi:hypothetical protein